MSLITQVLTALGWIVVLLAISPMVWLIVQPYFKGWSRAERRAADLLRDTLTPEQFRQLIWRGYLEVPSPTEPQRVYPVPGTKGYIQLIENARASVALCVPSC